MVIYLFKFFPGILRTRHTPDPAFIGPCMLLNRHKPLPAFLIPNVFLFHSLLLLIPYLFIYFFLAFSEYNLFIFLYLAYCGPGTFRTCHLLTRLYRHYIVPVYQAFNAKLQWAFHQMPEYVIFPNLNLFPGSQGPVNSYHLVQCNCSGNCTIQYTVVFLPAASRHSSSPLHMWRLCSTQWLVSFPQSCPVWDCRLLI